MDKKDYKLAYDYIYNLINLDDESMKWPLTIDSMAIFKELVDEKLNKPTLEEVKKEWEEKEFNVEVTNRFIYIDRQESNNYFIFDRLELRCHSHSGWTNLEIINLITKTLKALE